MEEGSGGLMPFLRLKLYKCAFYSSNITFIIKFWKKERSYEEWEKKSSFKEE